MTKSEDLRKLRLNLMKNLINSNFWSIDKKERIVSLFCVEVGVARRTALEYFNLLVNAGVVLINKESGIYVKQEL